MFIDIFVTIHVKNFIIDRNLFYWNKNVKPKNKQKFDVKEQKLCTVYVWSSQRYT